MKTREKRKLNIYFCALMNVFNNPIRSFPKKKQQNASESFTFLSPNLAHLARLGKHVADQTGACLWRFKSRYRDFPVFILSLSIDHRAVSRLRMQLANWSCLSVISAQKCFQFLSEKKTRKSGPGEEETCMVGLITNLSSWQRSKRFLFLPFFGACPNLSEKHFLRAQELN